jgi:aconitate decarboxylase
MPADATHLLIERLHALRFADLSATCVERCKTFIVDSIGVALVGHRHPLASKLINAVAELGAGAQCRIIGTDQRLPGAHAAMLNAFLIHCQEFDCVHEAAVVHPMAVILATLLAESERNPALNGRDLITGIVAAVDFAATLGMASRSKLKFFRPAFASGMAAAAALCKLRGGGVAEIRNTIGVMLGQLSGTMQAHREGVSLLPMQIAFAARNAWTAAALAQAGVIGPTDAIEGEFGYLNLFETEHDLPAALNALCDQQDLQHAIEWVSHKPFPSGRATHAGLNALRTILDRQAISNLHLLAPERIESIELYAPPLIVQLVARPSDPNQSAGYLKLCFAYCAASLLIDGRLDVVSFEPAAVADRKRHALASRIRVIVDHNPDPNALAPVRLNVQVQSHTTQSAAETPTAGQQFEQIVTQALGHPSHPLTTYQHQEKFFNNWKLCPCNRSQLQLGPEAWLDRAMTLENLPQAGNLLEDLPLISAGD